MDAEKRTKRVESANPEDAASRGELAGSESPTALNEHGFPDALLDLLGAHTSVRRFQRRPLEDSLVRRAVAAAQMASTSSHIQAYSLLRIRDTESRARLADLTGGQAQVSEAGAFFVICGEVRRHALAAERAGAPLARNLESFFSR